MRKLTAAAIAFTFFMVSHAVRADPLPTVPGEFQTTTTCKSTGGGTWVLPPGWWLVPPDTWSDLDTKLRRLQTAETRLTAENTSLRKSARERSSRWYLLTGALSLGLAAGQGWYWWRTR